MKCKILIVDDEKNLRETLSRILSHADYEVVAANSGQAALEILKQSQFNLAFIDLEMPDMHGIDLLPHIRQLHPDMPVLILTGNGALDTAMQAVRQGARDYILKPAEPQMILDRVKEILAEQSQPARQRELIGQIQSLISELNHIADQDTPPGLFSAVPPSDPSRIFTQGVFVFDLHARHLTLAGEYIALPPTSFDYLLTLARHSPHTVSYENLVKEAQGYQVTRNEARDMTRWRVSELRKLIETDPKRPQYLITMRGSGYRLVTNPI